MCNAYTGNWATGHDGIWPAPKPARRRLASALRVVANRERPSLQGARCGGLAPCIMMMALAGSFPAFGQQSGGRLIGGRTRQTWIGALHDPNPHTRARACQALAILGSDAEDAVPALIDAMQDGDESVRTGAIAALGWIGDRAGKSVPHLLRLLLADDKTRVEVVRIQAAIARIGRPAVGALIAGLTRAQSATRVRILQTLGRMGSDAEDAVPALAGELEAGHSGTGCLPEVVDAIGRVGPRAKSVASALSRLLASAFLADAQEELDRRATRALTKIGRSPIQFLSEKLSGAEPDSRRRAVDLLGEVGPDAMPCASKLATIVVNRQFGGELRWEAALALSAIDPASCSALGAITRLPERERSGEARVLARLGPFAFPALPSFIEDLERDEVVDFESIRALVRVDPEGLLVVPALVRVFRRSDIGGREFTRDWATWALGQIGPGARQSVPLLVKAFTRLASEQDHGGKTDVALCIARALKSIRSEPEVVVGELLPILRDHGKRRLHPYAVMAMMGCGRVAAKALPTLVPLLREDGPTRALVAQLLGQMGSAARQALPAVRAAITESHDTDKKYLVLALFRIDPANVTGADEIVDSIGSFECRAALLGFLGRLNTEGLGLARIKLRLLDEELAAGRPGDPYQPDPVEELVGALGSYGPAASAAIPRLEALLTDWRPSVRRAAKHALASIEGASHSD